jgi:hypothetical protein
MSPVELTLYTVRPPQNMEVCREQRRLSSKTSEMGKGGPAQSPGWQRRGRSVDSESPEDLWAKDRGLRS